MLQSKKGKIYRGHCHRFSVSILQNEKSRPRQVQCDQMLEWKIAKLSIKVDTNIATSVFLKIAICLNSPKYLGYFCKKICSYNI